MASAANARTNMPCKASSAPPPRRPPANIADEIVPLADQDEERSTRPRGAESLVDVTVDHDECNRPDTTLEGLAALKPVHAGGQQVAARQVHHRRQCLAIRRWRLAPAW